MKIHCSQRHNYNYNYAKLMGVWQTGLFVAGMSTMDDVLDIREIWFTNMLLLGFDPLQEETKHKISFHK